MTEWPQYESHKVVRAARIVSVERRPVGAELANMSIEQRWALVTIMVDPGTGVFEPFQPTMLDMRNHAEVGAWAMVYPDGFKSISPARAFTEGYTRKA